MGQDSTKVLMGTTRSSSKQGSEVFASDPLTYLAGLAVRRNSSGLLSIVKADGGWVGLSLGRSLSDITKTTVLLAGEQVPVLVERQPARGSFIITSFGNLVSGTADSVTVGATVFTAQAGAATAGTGTFQAATSNNATANSLVAQINAHATAKVLVGASIDPSNAAKVIVTAKSNTTSGDTIALAYTNGDANVGATVSGSTLDDSDDTADFIAIGQPVYFSDSTGKADDKNSGATISNAIYVSGLMTGVAEDGSLVSAALVDMAGGL